MILGETSYRKWMVVIAAATLVVAIMRLWVGG
jgi:uncharacterized membrane protein YjjP (DUF1212 family)